MRYIRLDVILLVMAAIIFAVLTIAHMEQCRQELLEERAELEYKIELLLAEQERLAGIRNNLEKQRDELAEKNAEMREMLYMPERGCTVNQKSTETSNK